ncbi:unnamed protein product [Amoebophrya sp. A25]|nr:unnamed protein product [Amoebophrya sp. A25]|eukprot:GSA25T00006693001.1
MHQLLNDRHPAVRRALSEMVQKLVHTGLTSHWAEERIDFDSDEEQLMKFERYEHRLLYLLLNCIVDGDEEGVGKPCLAKFEGLAETASEWWKKAEARRRRRQRNIEAAQKRVEAKLNGGEAEEEGEDAQSDAHVVDSEDFATEDEWNFPDFDHMIEQHAFKESSTCGALPSVFGTSIPSAKMCFYVYRHMERLLPQCLSNLIQWTSELRTSAARLLKLFLVFLHRFAAEKAEEILVHLYKAVEDEDADVRTNVHVCAQNLSLFVAAHTKQRLLVEIISTHLGIAYDSTEHAGGYLNREAAQRADSQHDEYWGETSMNRAKVRVEYDKKKEKPFVAISLENKRQVLKILAQVAKVFSYEDSPEGVSEDVLSQIVRFLEESATLDELLLTILELLSGVLVDPSSGDSSSSSTSTFSTGKKKMLSKQWTRIFDILLRCKSSVDPTENSAEVARIVDLSDQCIEALASRVCDCSVPDVYRLHLSSQLHTLLEQADLIQWPESSPKRAIFDLLVKNSVHAISGEHLDRIVPVLAKQAAVLTPSAPRHNDELEQEVAKEGSTLKSVQTGVSPRARIDILGILHFLVMQSTKFEVVKEGLRRHALFLWEEMLLPNASWRPGQSQNKIRKATMVCIHQFLELDLIDTSSLETLFPDVLPILRTCMDDSWSPDNRLVATLVTTLLLEKLDSLEDEQLRDLYPELLKRLDDSQDEVRATACAAFSAFFRALPEKWSPNLFQYILTSLFIHFDDPNPRIQHAVQACLETALHHNLAVFVQEAEKASVKAVHAKQLSDLILVAKNLMEN